MTTWLICGGRFFADQLLFTEGMTELCAARGMPTRIVHGAAKGADAMAGAFARQMGITEYRVPADWATHGRAAGPIRNQLMLDHYKPTLVIAFPGGRGTADMVDRARKAKVEVVQVTNVKTELSR